MLFLPLNSTKIYFWSINYVQCTRGQVWIEHPLDKKFCVFCKKKKIEMASIIKGFAKTMRNFIFPCSEKLMYRKYRYTVHSTVMILLLQWGGELSSGKGILAAMHQPWTSGRWVHLSATAVACRSNFLPHKQNQLTKTQLHERFRGEI